MKIHELLTKKDADTFAKAGVIKHSALEYLKIYSVFEKNRKQTTYRQAVENTAEDCCASESKVKLAVREMCKKI